MNSLLSLQVGLRLYDDLNERMSREEATRIRDFVTTEAHQVSLNNKKLQEKLRLKHVCNGLAGSFAKELNFFS